MCCECDNVFDLYIVKVEEAAEKIKQRMIEAAHARIEAAKLQGEEEEEEEEEANSLKRKFDDESDDE